MGHLPAKESPGKEAEEVWGAAAKAAGPLGRPLRGRPGHAGVFHLRHFARNFGPRPGLFLVECQPFVGSGSGSGLFARGFGGGRPTASGCPRARLRLERGLRVCHRESHERNLAAAIVLGKALLPAHSGGRHHHDQRKRLLLGPHLRQDGPNLPGGRFGVDQIDRVQAVLATFGQVELPVASHGHGCFSDALGGEQLVEDLLPGRVGIHVALDDQHAVGGFFDSIGPPGAVAWRPRAAPARNLRDMYDMSPPILPRPPLAAGADFADLAPIA